MPFKSTINVGAYELQNESYLKILQSQIQKFDSTLVLLFWYIKATGKLCLLRR